MCINIITKHTASQKSIKGFFNIAKTYIYPKLQHPVSSKLSVFGKMCMGTFFPIFIQGFFAILMLGRYIIFSLY